MFGLLFLREFGLGVGWFLGSPAQLSPPWRRTLALLGSLIVASYNSQGYGEGIQTHLYTGTTDCYPWFSLDTFGMDCRHNTTSNSFSVVSLLFQYLFVSPPPLSLIDSIPVTRQRLSKQVPAATKTHATIAELLNASFSARSASYKRRVCI
jgi:hypothetical protein